MYFIIIILFISILFHYHNKPLSFQMVLAKALYDNIAETPDEIAFSRGDILTVVERDTRGLEGWWLCTLRDKTGIAPGNRLRILAGMYTPRAGDLTLTPVLQRQKPAEEGGSIYQTPPSQGDINWRRSWLVESDKVCVTVSSMPSYLFIVYIYIYLFIYLLHFSPVSTDLLSWTFNNVFNFFCFLYIYIYFLINYIYIFYIFLFFFYLIN